MQHPVKPIFSHLSLLYSFPETHQSRVFKNFDLFMFQVGCAEIAVKQSAKVA